MKCCEDWPSGYDYLYTRKPISHYDSKTGKRVLQAHDVTCDIAVCTVPLQRLCGTVTLISACVIIIIVFCHTQRWTYVFKLCFSPLAFYTIGLVYLKKSYNHHNMLLFRRCQTICRRC